MTYEYKFRSFGVIKTHQVEANSEVGADKKLLKQIESGQTSPDVWQRHISTTELKSK